MKQFLRSPWSHYGVALLLSIAALALTQLNVWRDGYEYIPLLLAILLTARFGGLGPGLFTSILTLLASDYLFISPVYSLQVENPNDLFKLGGLALSAIILSWLAAAYRNSKQHIAILASRQSLIAKLSETALTSQDQSDLLTVVAPLLCESFNVEYAGIMQFLPDATSVLLKAGCGWSEGSLGRTLTATDVAFLSGGTLLQGEPSVFDILQNEKDSRTPKLLLEHQVKSGMSILIPGEARPFGMAGVYTSNRRRFSDADLKFLKIFSELLSKAITRIEFTEQRREESRGLRRTLASIAEGVIVLDSHGIVTFINSVAQTLTGFSQKDAVLLQIDSIFQVVNEKSDDAIQNPATRALSTGSVSTLETPAALISKNGKRISIDASAAPILDESGKSTGVVLIFRDTTVPRRIEESIRQSEERLRVALKNSPVVVSNQDTDLRYTWVHNSLHGFPDQSAVGKRDADLMPTVDSGRWSEIKRSVIESGIGTRVEISASLEGQKRSFDLTVEPLRNQQDLVVGVTCAAIEITERKREQAAISRLAAIVESSEDAIIGKTLDGIILSWNPGAERLYGYDSDEIIGQSVSVLYPPNRLDEFRQVTERLKKGELVEQHDTVRVRRDGKQIDVSVSISLVRDSLGRVIGASSIARDITQRKRVEELQRFRAEVSDVLGSSLEYKTIFERITRLAVPRMANWCSAHLLTSDGKLELVSLAHADPFRLGPEELLSRYPVDPNDSNGVSNVIRTGQPEFVEKITDEMLAVAARDSDHLKLLTELGLKSYLIVPLTVRRKTFGAISFGLTESNRHFSDDDRALLQDLATRAALLVENAHLFQELQDANAELEQRVVRRTIELQGSNTKLQAEIAERQRANEQLRQLSAHLQSAREEERTRVAREIHDELGQVLTVVKMDLSLLERNLSESGMKNPNEDWATQIHATTQLVDDSIHKMREIIRELRPGILDHLGLKSAIEWQAQEFQSRTNIECHLETGEEEISLDLDRATAVFRIFQETLTNIARHSQASRVDIRLDKHDHLMLEVRDNGRGITENEISDAKSFGILGMRERALIFGGEVEVHGEPGTGTVVRVCIPMEKPHD